MANLVFNRLLREIFQVDTRELFDFSENAYCSLSSPKYFFLFYYSHTQ